MEIDDKEYQELQDRIEFLTEDNKTNIAKRDSLKSQKRELEAEIEKLKNEIQQFETFNDKVNALSEKVLKDNMKHELISNKIIESASRHGAYKPEQVSKLIDTRLFKYDDNTKSFYIPLMDANKKEVGKQSLDEYIEQYLNNPENDNLVKSKVKIGLNVDLQNNYSTGIKGRHVSRKSIKGIADAIKKASKEDVQQADLMGLSLPDFYQIKTLKEKKLQGR